MRGLYIIALMVPIWLSFPNQNDWELKKEENGIKVYVRNQEGSKLKELKLTTTFNTELSPLVHVISDKNNLKEWVYSCSESELLKTVSPKETYHYQVSDFPWPLEDRDLVAHTTVSQNPISKEVKIGTVAVDGMVPTKRKRTRIKDMVGEWKLKPINSKQVYAEYILSIDPAGSIPAWVINLGISEGPLKSMESLKKELPKHANQKVNYIKEYSSANAAAKK